MRIYDNVLDLIGNTPLIRLGRIKKDVEADLLAKLEFFSPSGSVKDRIALSMIEEAERKGLIKKGDCIVEPTSGNTGTGLAMVCTLKGYRMIAVLPEQMSQERKDMMAAFGAELVLVPSQGEAEPGTFTKEDIEATVQKAEELASQPGYYMPNQFTNPHNTLAHEKTTAEEIWAATSGKIDAFVAGVGTAGTTMGVSLGLKRRNPEIKIYAVEPENSAVISGESPSYHRLQGIGEGFIPDLYKHENCDGVIKVSDVEAKATACRLARLEGIFAGYSSGANVFASLKIAKNIGKDKTIVTIIPDSGMKYLSTDLFRYAPEVCTDQCCTLEDFQRKEDCLSLREKRPCCAIETC